jgi:hypothetical protein
MPSPIIPIGYPARQQAETPSSPEDIHSGIDVSILGGIIKSDAAKKNIKLSDSEASLLFRVWRESGESMGDTLDLPDTVSNSDVLRLKTLGLVVGEDTRKVKFTQRAKQVIKTIVLNEENAFESKRVHKPYGQILADSEKIGKMRFALGKKKT